MKKLLATLTFLTGIVLQLSGQESTLSWETHIEQENASEYVLVLKASLKEGWHLYSQHLPEGGPLATEISFENPQSNFQCYSERLCKGKPGSPTKKSLTWKRPILKKKPFLDNASL